MIRAAVEADLPKVAEIYEEILALEERTGVTTTNWQRGKYPTRDDARRALEAGTLYVMEEEGDLFGCVNLNGEQLPEYDAIPWSFAAGRDQVMVIHTLCISPRWAGSKTPPPTISTPSWATGWRARPCSTSWALSGRSSTAMSEFSNRFFNPENDFFGFLGDLVDVVGLSILWLFCCLPVVTIGPACTALYHTVLRGLRQRQPGRYLRFLRCFRDNLKQGAAVTLLCLPAGLLFYFGLPALTALALAGDRMAELLFWCWQTLAVLLALCPWWPSPYWAGFSLPPGI